MQNGAAWNNKTKQAGAARLGRGFGFDRIHRAASAAESALRDGRRADDNGTLIANAHSTRSKGAHGRSDGGVKLAVGDAVSAAVPHVSAMARRFGVGIRSLSARVGWLSAGFVVGALTWHFVGFWGFVSEIMYERPGATARVAELAAASRVNDTSQIITGSLQAKKAAGAVVAAPVQPVPRKQDEALAASPVSSTQTAPEPCVELELDRVTGTTREATCAPLASPLATQVSTGRGDRLAVMTPVVEAQIDEAPVGLDPAAVGAR